MDFDTLDAQRDAGEIFVKAQLHHGWEVLPTRYDDGGFTGGNMDRPALERREGATARKAMIHRDSGAKEPPP